MFREFRIAVAMGVVSALVGSGPACAQDPAADWRKASLENLKSEIERDAAQWSLHRAVTRQIQHDLGALLDAAAARAREEEGRDDPVPAKNEVVMTPGMKITATTPNGTIAITAGKGLKRSYTWNGATRSVQMWPRKERWYGSLGLYFPGPGDHWEEHDGITRGVLEEAQQHFGTHDEAVEWLEQRKATVGNYIGPPLHIVHRNDGLVVQWGKTPQRNQLYVDVRQILINGQKPTELPGSEDDTIVVQEPDDSDGGR